MRRAAPFMIVAFTVLACSPVTTESSAKDDKGTVVELDGLSSKAPAEWKEETPSNQMRLAQFKLPKEKDDKFDAELVIFKGISGSAKQNVERWKGQFVPAKGKTIEDVSKVEEFKVSERPVTYLDISGTYKFKARPFDPKAEEEARPDYRMLAVQIDGKNDSYQIKLTGPAKTVEKYKKGFDEWLKAFK
jgi:hypothetical protein